MTVSVRESPVFYGWLATFGDDAEVVRLEALRNGYTDWIKAILGRYEK